MITKNAIGLKKENLGCGGQGSIIYTVPQQILWRHDEYDGVSNHRRLDCLLKRFLRRGSKKTSKLRVTGFCEGNSPVISRTKGQ